MLFFNRPGETARVFEAVARARPRTLLLVADGPRPTVPRDAERCAATRAVVDRIDWPCDVLHNFSDRNLGCTNRVVSGLDWAFSRVDCAIVLEDDCVPDPSFFPYAEALLERYYDDERIVHIAGSGLGHPIRTAADSYIFSRFPIPWGWATWSRAWRHFDVRMTDWPLLRDSGWLQTLLGDPVAVAAWEDIFGRVYAGGVNDWTFQWVYTCWRLDGLSTIPSVNLVSNIGITDDATHMDDAQEWGYLVNRPTSGVKSTLNHPATIATIPAMEAMIRAFWVRARNKHPVAG